jgi:hypothetical protein
MIAECSNLEGKVHKWKDNITGGKFFDMWFGNRKFKTKKSNFT